MLFWPALCGHSEIPPFIWCWLAELSPQPRTPTRIYISAGGEGGENDECGTFRCIVPRCTQHSGMSRQTDISSFECFTHTLPRCGRHTATRCSLYHSERHFRHVACLAPTKATGEAVPSLGYCHCVLDKVRSVVTSHSPPSILIWLWKVTLPWRFAVPSAAAIAT